MGKSRRSFLKSIAALVAGAALPLRTAAAVVPALGTRAWVSGFVPVDYYVVMHPEVERELLADGFEIGRWESVRVHVMESVARHG